ncbi:MAG: 50S ribosomal protein L13 [Candidatus Krumholzibacteriota bacterium]|nr:50S ribosomal protein L13 [Candidatus Krumholzibacteriota bacterium]
MKTHVTKVGDLEERWYLVDAEGQTLGRLATRVATVLRGKHRPDFSPHMDMGDHVIVVNADKIRVTGNSKPSKKLYTRYSGYPSGLKTRTLAQLLESKPEDVVAHAVRGMLPKNRLGRKLVGKLRVYRGAGHPHSAQQPEPLDL